MIEFESFASSILKTKTNAYDVLWYSVPETRRHNVSSANNRYNITLNDRIHNIILNYFEEEDINMVCSWYMNYHVDKLEKLGYNITYYDSDPYVCEDCDLISENIKNVDVIFDNVKFKGPVDKIIFKLIGGLKSSMGYLGSKKVLKLRNKPKFVKITKAGFYESMVHNIDEIKGNGKY